MLQRPSICYIFKSREFKDIKYDALIPHWTGLWCHRRHFFHYDHIHHNHHHRHYHQNGWGIWRWRDLSANPLSPSMEQHHQESIKGLTIVTTMTWPLTMTTPTTSSDAQVPAKDLVVILFMFLLWAYSIHLTYRYRQCRVANQIFYTEQIFKPIKVHKLCHFLNTFTNSKPKRFLMIDKLRSPFLSCLKSGSK